MTKYSPDWPVRPGERPVDHLIATAELCGEMWQRAGYDAHERIREHSRHWPGGRTGRLRLIAAALAGAKRVGRAKP
jgi:hypothetical protein